MRSLLSSERLLLLSIFCLWGASASAFDWKRCSSVYGTSVPQGGGGGFVGFFVEMITTGLTTAVTSVPATTSYIGNFGPCARSASPDGERKAFVAQHANDLRAEAAKGAGEHVDALANLFKVKDAKAFSRLLHDNYQRVFGAEKAMKNPEEVYKAISELLAANRIQ